MAAALLPGLAFGFYAVSAGLMPAHASPARVPVRILLLSQIAAYVPLITYLLAVVPRLAHRSLAQLGVRRPTRRDIAAGVLGTAAMWAIVAAASTIITAFTHEHETETAVQLLRELRTPGDIFAFTTIAVVLAPMIEEFAFRVFLFNAISRHTSTSIGAIACGVLFGLVHGTAVSVAIPLALGGILLAFVYARTGCYWSNVITHALFNAVSVVAVLAFHVSD
jgi:membrane protease YdiL (CAAX protease family)